MEKRSSISLKPISGHSGIHSGEGVCGENIAKLTTRGGFEETERVLPSERERVRLNGILPISQSSFSEGSFPSDFALVGSGDAYAGCGSYYTVGCLNVEGHKGKVLLGVHFDNKVYLERHRISCHRPLCPICWSGWANREADKAEARLNAFHLKGVDLKPIHVVVSVPHADYGLGLAELRKRVYLALKMVHCLGGMMIFHSKRQNDAGLWYFSPHFHVVGYGWIADVHQNFVRSGYIVKNVGVRKTVRGTIFYQLSHCGISENHHSVTWFGALSYNRLSVDYEVRGVRRCPLCGARLRRVEWIGEGPSPLPNSPAESVDWNFGVGFYDSPDNWLYLPSSNWDWGATKRDVAPWHGFYRGPG